METEVDVPQSFLDTTGIEEAQRNAIAIGLPEQRPEPVDIVERLAQELHDMSMNDGVLREMMEDASSPQSEEALHRVRQRPNKGYCKAFAVCVARLVKPDMVSTFLGNDVTARDLVTFLSA